MRSDCPISYALDYIGDKWTFLVVRDLIQGKRFYNEFIKSKEGIATNILSDRLKKLEQNGFIVSTVYEKLKTKKEYRLTEKGQDLIPVLLEMMVWSSKHSDKVEVSEELINKIETNRDLVITTIKSGLNF